MSKGFVFWLLMLLWFLFDGFLHWGTPQFGWHVGGNVLLFCVIALLGWSEFGAPIK